MGGTRIVHLLRSRCNEVQARWSLKVAHGPFLLDKSMFWPFLLENQMFGAWGFITASLKKEKKKQRMALASQ